MLLGYEIPEYLKSPEGDTISSWDNDDDNDGEETAPTADEATEKAASKVDSEED